MPYGGEPVDVWRRHASALTAAVGSEIAIAGVVGDDQNDAEFSV
jgi:hypothetical protein